MSKKLVIRGDKERGNEVIALLEMLGGDNRWKTSGNIENVYYGISNDVILYYQQLEKGTVIFTLDEFYEKYPYKVGDKVTLDNKLCTIIWMCWECNNIYYMVQAQGAGVMYTKKVTVDELKPYKEQEDMETKVECKLIVSEDVTKNERMEIDLNEYEYKVENDKLIILKKKPVYPKTYRECFYTLYGHKNDAFNLSGVTDEEYDLISNFIILTRCRDAYWKIAGEQMGLDGSWESPLPSLFETIYCIRRKNNEIIKGSYRGGKSEILEFPTEEMRDAFYENFKELIEQCKDLL